MLVKLLFDFLINLFGMEKGAQTQRQGIEPLFDVHIQASLSCTISEMAAETRFQLAVAFHVAFVPIGSANKTWPDGCVHSLSTGSNPSAMFEAFAGRVKGN